MHSPPHPYPHINSEPPPSSMILAKSTRDRCASASGMFIAITAHLCNQENVRLLNTTLASVRRYAPDAEVVVFDSSSPWPVAELCLIEAAAHPAQVVRVHRTTADVGQLGVMCMLDSVKPLSSGLIFLQHTTQLTQCAADIAQRIERKGCVAEILGTSISMERRFWREHHVTGMLLAALGTPHNLRPPWNFAVAEHSTVFLSSEAWRRASELGLWRSNGTEQLPAVRALLDARSRRTSLVLINQAVEAITGFLVAWCNRILGESNDGNHAGRGFRIRGDSGCMPPLNNKGSHAILKTHGENFQRGHCKPWKRQACGATITVPKDPGNSSTPLHPSALRVPLTFS